MLTGNARKVGDGMKLIDADALADALFEKRKNYPQWVADMIGAMPDAIVRCKDCKYSFEKWGKVCCSSILLDKITFVDADWFCADGERRTE